MREHTREFNRGSLGAGLTTYKLAWEGKYYWMLDNCSERAKTGKVIFSLSNLRGPEQLPLAVSPGEHALAVFVVQDEDKAYELAFMLA